MKKEVLVSVKGLQTVNEDIQDEQRVETINHGTYYRRNGKHFVTYEETSDNMSEVIKVILKFDEHTLEVTKKGEFAVHLDFCAGEKRYSNYSTPFGTIVTKTTTESVSLLEKPDLILVTAAYDLELNYSFVGHCTIDICIRPLP